MGNINGGHKWGSQLGVPTGGPKSKTENHFSPHERRANSAKNKTSIFISRREKNSCRICWSHAADDFAVSGKKATTGQVGKSVSIFSIES
jgi:hypothetical protein